MLRSEKKNGAQHRNRAMHKAYLYYFAESDINKLSWLALGGFIFSFRIFGQISKF